MKSNEKRCIESFNKGKAHRINSMQNSNLCPTTLEPKAHVCKFI
jgi:hypothetical protein